MLSRVTLCYAYGAFGSVVKRTAIPCLQQVHGRYCSQEADSMIQNWEKANKIYYGPERDHKNFPIRKQPDMHPPVRVGFMPESWFNFLYDKTGVTGPYMLGIGLTTFLLSKEIWVIEHNFGEFISFWLVVTILIKKYGKSISDYLINYRDQLLESKWHKPLKGMKKTCQDVIDEKEKSIWSEEGQKYLFESKRENVDLQLESIYRQRLAEVTRNVKRCLDYQLDTETAKIRFEQMHMVRWIVDNVVKGISPQQEKDSLKKCLTDLKALSAKAATA